MVSVQTEDFNVGEELENLKKIAGDCGAIVSFTGLVREFGATSNTHAMTLEHYPGMTEKALEKIEQQAMERWPLNAVRTIHRVGKLSANDNIVFIAVASAHRKAAFEAAQFIMDILKTDAPFWKKEHTNHGDHWVEQKTSDHTASGSWK